MGRTWLYIFGDATRCVYFYFFISILVIFITRFDDEYYFVIVNKYQVCVYGYVGHV